MSYYPRQGEQNVSQKILTFQMLGFGCLILVALFSYAYKQKKRRTRRRLEVKGRLHITVRPNESRASLITKSAV